MSQSGGLISRVFRRLIAFSQKNIKFVGEDHYGNKYYEKTAGE
jgi:NADH:ubiquinone oxidoreductase subunit